MGIAWRRMPCLSASRGSGRNGIESLASATDLETGSGSFKAVIEREEDARSPAAKVFHDGPTRIGNRKKRKKNHLTSPSKFLE
jgi:hypothetical protein